MNYEFCASLFFVLTSYDRFGLYLYSTDIGAGPDAKFSLFRLTVGKLWPCLCCLFGQKRLLFSYIALSTFFFVPEKKKIASSGPGTS